MLKYCFKEEHFKEEQRKLFVFFVFFVVNKRTNL